MALSFLSACILVIVPLFWGWEKLHYKMSMLKSIAIYWVIPIQRWLQKIKIKGPFLKVGKAKSQFVYHENCIICIAAKWKGNKTWGNTTSRLGHLMFSYIPIFIFILRHHNFPLYPYANLGNAYIYAKVKNKI